MQTFFGKKELFFSIKFFIIFLVLQFFILSAPLAQLENFIASAEAGALGLQSSGNIVFFEDQSFQVGANCTGLLSGAILFAVVFAMKKPDFRKKLLIAAAGALVLFLLNFPRVFFVLWAAKNFGAGLAETLHEITWMTTAVLVLIVWFFAIRKIAKTKNFAELI
ncbi:MAG TPA: exosortase/archaeosortase family protein [archaeon]|nr:exosortase/archaeosortase family protein [archaeon]